jgi:hypothetical protein
MEAAALLAEDRRVDVLPVQALAVKLTAAYETGAELVADAESQFAKGGLLVRGDAPPGLALFQDVELAIVFGEQEVVLKGQVVQIVAGAGVAVAFQPTPELDELVVEARKPTVVGVGARPAAVKNNVAEQIQKALHGTKDERAAVMRDINKMVHPYVLKNPQLGVDEVLAFAKMTTLAPELLKQIADRKEWAQRPEIAIALVRNAKTPVEVALKLLGWITPQELRHLAKDNKAKPQIAQAARRKVLGS